jgi:hypothetical protein
MRTLFKTFGPYAHSMGGGPRMIATAGRRPEKDIRHRRSYIRYRMQAYDVSIYYDIVCDPTIM